MPNVSNELSVRHPWLDEGNIEALAAYLVDMGNWKESMSKVEGVCARLLQLSDPDKEALNGVLLSSLLARLAMIVNHDGATSYQTAAKERKVVTSLPVNAEKHSSVSLWFFVPTVAVDGAATQARSCVDLSSVALRGFRDQILSSAQLSAQSPHLHKNKLGATPVRGMKPLIVTIKKKAGQGSEFDFESSLQPSGGHSERCSITPLWKTSDAGAAFTRDSLFAKSRHSKADVTSDIKNLTEKALSGAAASTATVRDGGGSSSGAGIAMEVDVTDGDVMVLPAAMSSPKNSSTGGAGSSSGSTDSSSSMDVDDSSAVVGADFIGANVLVGATLRAGGGNGKYGCAYAGVHASHAVEQAQHKRWVKYNANRFSSEPFTSKYAAKRRTSLIRPGRVPRRLAFEVNLAGQQGDANYENIREGGVTLQKFFELLRTVLPRLAAGSVAGGGAGTNNARTAVSMASILSAVSCIASRQGGTPLRKTPRSGEGFALQGQSSSDEGDDEHATRHRQLRRLIGTLQLHCPEAVSAAAVSRLDEEEENKDTEVFKLLWCAVFRLLFTSVLPSFLDVQVLVTQLYTWAQAVPEQLGHTSSSTTPAKQKKSPLQLDSGLIEKLLFMAGRVLVQTPASELPTAVGERTDVTDEVRLFFLDAEAAAVPTRLTAELLINFCLVFYWFRGVPVPEDRRTTVWADDIVAASQRQKAVEVATPFVGGTISRYVYVLRRQTAVVPPTVAPRASLTSTADDPATMSVFPDECSYQLTLLDYSDDYMIRDNQKVQAKEVVEWNKKYAATGEEAFLTTSIDVEHGFVMDTIAQKGDELVKGWKHFTPPIEGTRKSSRSTQVPKNLEEDNAEIPVKKDTFKYRFTGEMFVDNSGGGGVEDILAFAFGAVLPQSWPPHLRKSTPTVHSSTATQVADAAKGVLASAKHILHRFSAGRSRQEDGLVPAVAGAEAAAAAQHSSFEKLKAHNLSDNDFGNLSDEVLSPICNAKTSLGHATNSVMKAIQSKVNENMKTQQAEPTTANKKKVQQRRALRIGKAHIHTEFRRSSLSVMMPAASHLAGVTVSLVPDVPAKGAAAVRVRIDFSDFGAQPVVERQAEEGAAAATKRKRGGGSQGKGKAAVAGPSTALINLGKKFLGGSSLSFRNTDASKPLNIRIHSLHVLSPFDPGKDLGTAAHPHVTSALPFDCPLQSPILISLPPNSKRWVGIRTVDLKQQKKKWDREGRGPVTKDSLSCHVVFAKPIHGDAAAEIVRKTHQAWRSPDAPGFDEGEVYHQHQAKPMRDRLYSCLSVFGRKATIRPILPADVAADASTSTAAASGGADTPSVSKTELRRKRRECMDTARRAARLYAAAGGDGMTAASVKAADALIENCLLKLRRDFLDNDTIKISQSAHDDMARAPDVMENVRSAFGVTHALIHHGGRGLDAAGSACEREIGPAGCYSRAMQQLTAEFMRTRPDTEFDGELRGRVPIAWENLRDKTGEIGIGGLRTSSSGKGGITSLYMTPAAGCRVVGCKNHSHGAHDHQKSSDVEEACAAFRNAFAEDPLAANAAAIDPGVKTPHTVFDPGRGIELEMGYHFGDRLQAAHGKRVRQLQSAIAILTNQRKKLAAERESISEQNSKVDSSSDRGGSIRSTGSGSSEQKGSNSDDELEMMQVDTDVETHDRCVADVDEDIAALDDVLRSYREVSHVRRKNMQDAVDRWQTTSHTAYRKLYDTLYHPPVGKWANSMRARPLSLAQFLTTMKQVASKFGAERFDGEGTFREMAVCSAPENFSTQCCTNPDCEGSAVFLIPGISVHNTVVKCPRCKQEWPRDLGAAYNILVACLFSSVILTADNHNNPPPTSRSNARWTSI